MSARKLLVVLASLALVALSFAPVNALIADRAEVVHRIRGHDALARRKRSDTSSPTGLCKPRPSSPPSTPTPTPTPSTTPTYSTSSPAPSPSSDGSKKFGLAWGSDPQVLDAFASRPDVGFLYTWNPSLPSDLAKYGVEGIPMLWGPGDAYVPDFQRLVVPGYARYVAGMNEPNEPSQSNLSPQDAFNMWMQYINPLKDQGYTLISPACTDDDSGLAWYQEFFDLCGNSTSCHVDIVAFHSYTTSAQHVIDYATQLHTTYQKDIMITEYADQNFSGTGGQASMDQVWTYAGVVKNFVQSTSWVRAAFPFGVVDNLQGVNTLNAVLDTTTNQPTSLGYYYFG